MSNYLTELVVIHSALTLGYWLFLRNEQQYAKMRGFLLGATVLSLLIPLLKLPKLFFTSKVIEEPVAVGTMAIEPMMVVPAEEASISYLDMLAGVAIVISIIFLIIFLRNIFYLIRLRLNSSLVFVEGVKVRKTMRITGTFTFFDWIFVGDDLGEGEEDCRVILRHEQAHVYLGHSFDLIFIELFKVIFWWLPTTWFVQKELRKIHEYQADAYALKTYDIDRYSKILISSTLKSNGLSLASSFHDGLIFKRIIAMKKQAKNVSPWKVGVLSILVTFLFTMFACSEELDQEIREMGKNSNAVTFDQLPASMQSNLGDIKDHLTFMKVEVKEGDKISEMEQLAALDPDLIQSMNVDKVNGLVYVAVKKSGAHFDMLAEKTKMDGEVFTVVEELPQFKGGTDAFYRYIMNEIRYPKMAREHGLEGMVVVQFIIEKDGSLTDVQVIRDIGGGCGEEAARVISTIPQFKPGSQRGKPVRVRMAVPITFKLDKEKLNADNTSQGIIIADELQVRKEGTLKIEASYDNGVWTGKVLSPEGEKLPGASIVVVGTSYGTVSDLEGDFSIAAKETSELAVSFVGYEGVKVSN